MAARNVTIAEVGNHNDINDAWIVINNAVWDFSGFASSHPGGEEIIREYIGKDGSEPYNEVHSRGLVANHLGPDKKVGILEHEVSTTTSHLGQPGPPNNHRLIGLLPPIDTLLSLHDFEEVAKKAFHERSWVYFSGASNDCSTHTANGDWYRKIMFIPRMLMG